MSNSYFSFKQFKIEQDRTAMKVCTDSCLFGAWVAKTIKEAGHVLDIGAGTGLLSLMYAQQNPGSLIAAVELDNGAANQASNNCLASPWSNRLTVHHSSINDFKPPVKYDLIISNPPFYENDLLASEDARNKAMHGTTLTLDKLSDYINDLSSKSAKIAILLPYHRAEYFASLMYRSGWKLVSEVSVKQTPDHPFFRSMFCFSRTPEGDAGITELVIRNKNNDYTDDFAELLKDYYLYL